MQYGGILVLLAFGTALGIAVWLAFSETQDEDHGRHRQSGTTLHSRTNQITNFSAGGAATVYSGSDADTTTEDAGNSLGAGTMITPPAHWLGIYSYHNALAQAHMNQQQMAQQAIAMQNAWVFFGNTYVTASGQILPPHAKTDLKSEGIRAGEIIAWRAWRVDNVTLRSATADAAWDPDKPMEGDAAGGFGVHAYKNPHGPMLDSYADAAQNGMWVIGEVALWGDVIEHERGYRAQFGRVHSLVTWSRVVPQHLRTTIEARYIMTA